MLGALILLVLLTASGGQVEKTKRDEGPSRTEVLASVSLMRQEFVAVQSSKTKIDVIPENKNLQWRPEQLQSVPSTMREIMQKIKSTEPLPVTITLKKAMPLSEFEAFVKHYEIVVDGYQLRGLEKTKDGKYERLTYMASPRNGILISDKLREMEDFPNFKGVIAVYGELPFKNWRPISENPNVFVADISSQYVKEQLQHNKRIKEMVRGEGAQIEVHVPNFYWELEDAGVIRYDGFTID